MGCVEIPGAAGFEPVEREHRNDPRYQRESAEKQSAEREVAAITLNRWPHGYAYEFEGVGVSSEYDRYNGPHIAGRAQLGRISIANSDSEAHAYVDGAIDAADRAVNEQKAAV